MLLAWKHGHFGGPRKKNLSNKSSEDKWRQCLSVPEENEKRVTAHYSKETEVSNLEHMCGSRYEMHHIYQLVFFSSVDLSNFSVIGLSLISILHVSHPYFRHRIELFFWNVLWSHCPMSHKGNTVVIHSTPPSSHHSFVTTTMHRWSVELWFFFHKPNQCVGSWCLCKDFLFVGSSQQNTSKQTCRKLTEQCLSAVFNMLD